MSDASDESEGFAPPPFRAAAALVQLQRSLRDLKLAARGPGFELKGKRVIELALDTDKLQGKLARSLMLTPEWDRVSIGSATEQRKFIDEVKRRLARWERED